jgi:ADP-glucose pyrophosphorylase
MQAASVITVFVNDCAVGLPVHIATGAEIKAAAIAQGVQIQTNFVLENDGPEGSNVVEDHEKIELGNHQRFRAHEGKPLTVSVNEQPVRFVDHIATGAEIKAAAIAQGVQIQPNFVLQEELPNGTSRIVGDSDRVHLRPHMRFTAIAPDDNS